MGNIGDAAASGILVDLTPPVFSNHYPIDGSWHNHTDIDCSVEMYDGEGSGVDGSTIEYSVSATGENGLNLWIPAWVPEEGDKIIPSVKYIFPEGEENYIKWRAKDISGNGFSESPSINIKVDVTPVSFAGVITPHAEWYDTDTITTKITVSDAGSGVNPESLEARISTSGPADFDRWMPIDPGNISESGEDGFEITVTFTYSEGKNNYIMFRGTDMVGNPLTVSDKFNFKIDTSPVYFGIFTPDENEYAESKTVECFIQIFDEGSGVDPASVEYSVAKGAGGDNKNFGSWKKAANVVAGNPAQVLLEVEFDWGNDNYIRWRADDMMGTGCNESAEYRVWANSRPEAVISSPESGSYYRYDRQILFDASESGDEDGDSLGYYWSSNVSANRSIGSKVLMIADLVPGKHTITLFVSDEHGYNESMKVKIEVGSSVDYERDSDGDGFSDGLEREKGTDPRNGADRPDGEPDIVVEESAGILGEDSSLFFIILGGILLVIILVLAVFFIARKRKKTGEKDISQSARPVSQQPQYGPARHPYSQGPYMSPGQQGYGGTPQFSSPYAGMAGGQSPNLMLPPGPGMWNAQQSGPAQAGQPQLPQYDPSLQQSPYGQAANGPGDQVAAYSLPSFSTEQGLQNLERMALPPGPAHGFGDDTGSQVVPYPAACPEMPAQPAAIPDIGALETALSAPPAPVASTGQALPILPQASPPIPDPSIPGPIAPPADPSRSSDLTELDQYLSTLDEIYAVPPEPEQTPSPPLNEITMNHPQTGPRVSSSETHAFQRMQCHSCGNNYMAEIAQFPALVTCPVCQTQGVIEG